MHVKTGDEVLVIAGKDKGRKGKIKRALPREERVVVEGLNIVKRHMKARGPGKPGGIIEMEAPIHVSNVMLICPSCGRASRTGHRFLEETDHKGRPRKVRFCKACDAIVDK
ncbi:MAG: 50S ribosomal protein L24 [Oscillochloridaceae bacterium]|nr:50S ribosomal protein L24 [Chloroflexaceae bacterium]MDW8392124.1 50S ribosomal protein L24 [Oscillochloridaceae bacterium]